MNNGGEFVQMPLATLTKLPLLHGAVLTNLFAHTMYRKHIHAYIHTYVRAYIHPYVHAGNHAIFLFQVDIYIAPSLLQVFSRSPCFSASARDTSLKMQVDLTCGIQGFGCQAIRTHGQQALKATDAPGGREVVLRL